MHGQQSLGTTVLRLANFAASSSEFRLIDAGAMPIQAAGV